MLARMFLALMRKWHYFHLRLSGKMQIKKIDPELKSHIRTCFSILKNVPADRKLTFPLAVNGDGGYVVEQFGVLCPRCERPMRLEAGELVHNAANTVSFRTFCGCPNCHLCGIEHFHIRDGKYLSRRNIDLQAFISKYGGQHAG